MKVICQEKKYPSDEGLLTINKEYLVLEIIVTNGVCEYRIQDDGGGIPVSFDADQFTISDNRVYSNWVTYFDKKRNEFWISPARWMDNNLWQYSFWEDLCGDEDEKAKQVFEEEVAKMMKEDEENTR